jgi:hypothetical protein
VLEDALRATFAARAEQDFAARAEQDRAARAEQGFAGRAERGFAGRAERARPGQPGVDLATAAIRRGRRIRRRRTAATGVAAVVALAATLSGAITLRDWHAPAGRPPANLAEPLPSEPEPGLASTATRVEVAVPEGSARRKASSTTSPSGPFPSRGPGLDVWVGSELWTTAGKRMRLAGVDELRWVYRVRAGWVYGGPQQVRLLRPDGESVSLTDVDDAAALSAAAPLAAREQRSGDGIPGEPTALPRWVLSPDGTRMAFAAGEQLTVATITARGLVAGKTIQVAGDVVPLLFFGESIVLTTGQADRYGVWRPGRAYHPNWRDDITHVYGLYGTTLLGLARSDADPARTCLVLIAQTADGLWPGQVRGCGLDLATGSDSGVASPDGRWLALPVKGDIRLVDVAAAVSGATRTSTCPVSARAVPAWESASTLIVADGRQAIRCAVTGSVETFREPTGIPEGWRFVPSLLDT